MKQLLFGLLLLVPFLLKAQIITTIAGNGTIGYSGDGGAATAASLDFPNDVAVDGSGNVFIADINNRRIRKVSPGGVISTVAGNGTLGFSGDGGPATLAALNTPWGIAVDLAGNLYIADNYRIRKVNTAGIISTFAGTGTGGYTGDGGPATAAEVAAVGITTDIRGNIYFTDNRDCIRKIDSAGFISTIAGTGISGFSGDGSAATAAQVAAPRGIKIDVSGNIYFTDGNNDRVRKINPLGIITTIAGTGIGAFNGDGGLADTSQINQPTGLAVDAIGNIYIGDISNDRVRIINTSGIMWTIAGNGIFGFSGDGGLCDSSEIDIPQGLTTDADGNLYIVDERNKRVRKISHATTSAGNLRATKPDIAVYPNPTRNKLVVTSTDRINTVVITNTVGQTVFCQTCDAQKIELNLTGLATGVYFIRINGIEVRKFVRE